MSLPHIAVPRADARARERLLRSLGALYGVTFVPVEEGATARYEAMVLFDATRADALRWARAGVRCLAYIRGAVRPVHGTSDIAFADAPHVVPAFRGATLADPSIQSRRDVGADSEDQVIATTGTDVLWARRADGSGSADIVGVLPPAEIDTYLFTRFHQDEWFALLPLLCLLRDVSGWTAPPVRANLMFDDPNLHWRSYGYVHYEEIVEHARACGYHASFAMVPMDVWYAHSATARLFREHRDRLSLLIHGNNHTHYELFRASPRSQQLALASQAIRRMERFERVTGVPVSRVMAAPHGACSEEMATALAQTGFEAATISRGSLMSRNPDAPWSSTVGLSPAEWFGGLPILPRFNIHSETQSRVRFAAFLGQPVIPVGHHDDLQSGLDLMARIARVVNSIAGSVWVDTTRIARTNYLSRCDGEMLHVKMYSRTIEITVPAGVTRLCVERAWPVEPDSEAVCVQHAATGVSDRYAGEPMAVAPGALVTVTARPLKTLDPYAVPGTRTALQAIVRRQLCEGRDRLRPGVDRVREWISR
jgi:hypothetical protein